MLLKNVKDKGKLVFSVLSSITLIVSTKKGSVKTKEDSNSVIYKFFKIRKETMYLNKNMDVFHLLNLSAFSRQTVSRSKFSSLFSIFRKRWSVSK